MNTGDTPDANSPRPMAERLLTITQAAAALGIPAWKLQRAAKTGLVPTYSFFNSRRLVKLGELHQLIETSRNGGER